MALFLLVLFCSAGGGIHLGCVWGRKREKEGSVTHICNLIQSNTHKNKPPSYAPASTRPRWPPATAPTPRRGAASIATPVCWWFYAGWFDKLCSDWRGVVYLSKGGGEEGGASIATPGWFKCACKCVGLFVYWWFYAGWCDECVWLDE